MKKPFPINSTSVITPAIARTGRVLGRAKINERIAYAGCYNCRPVQGSYTYSQHSWGNALDLFPVGHNDPDLTQADLRKIADAVVLHATKRTIANRGRKLAVSQVIDHDARRIWQRGIGWRPYTGTTGAHVHVSGEPLRTGKPACA